MWKIISASFFILFLASGCESVTGAGTEHITSNTDLTPRTHIEVNDPEDDCPIGLVSGLTLDDEFGPGTQALTRCLTKRSQVRVMYQVNKSCTDTACTKPYALGNINNALNDYEITHGLTINLDFKLVMVIYSSGYRLVVNNDAPEPFEESNPFQAQIEKLLSEGVDIYFCQNTARSHGIMTAQLIPGIRWVTSGVTAVADFQQIGYAVVQP